MDDDEIYDPGVEVAYQLKTPDDARELYRKWAVSYEAGFVASNRYVYHERVAQVFVSRAGPGAGPVLDVGCGTGLVGQALEARGVHVIDGIDISPEMLAEAAAKQTGGGERVYRSLSEADLTDTLTIASGDYHGVVSAGTFTHGHVGPAALDELLRVAAPGCVFALGVNREVYESSGFSDRFAAESTAGTISDPDLVEVPVYDLTEGDHARTRAFVVTFTRV